MTTSKVPPKVHNILILELIEVIDEFLIPKQYINQLNYLIKEHEYISLNSNNRTWIKSSFHKYSLMKCYVKNRNYDAYILKKWSYFSRVLRSRYMNNE